MYISELQTSDFHLRQTVLPDDYIGSHTVFTIIQKDDPARKRQYSDLDAL